MPSYLFSRALSQNLVLTKGDRVNCYIRWVSRAIINWHIRGVCRAIINLNIRWASRVIELTVTLDG